MKPLQEDEACEYRETEAPGGDITCTGWLCCHVRTGMWPRCIKAPAVPPPRACGGQQLRALKSCLELSTRDPSHPGHSCHGTFICPSEGIRQNQNQGQTLISSMNLGGCSSDSPGDRQPFSTQQLRSQDADHISAQSSSSSLLPGPLLVPSLLCRRGHKEESNPWEMA